MVLIVTEKNLAAKKIAQILSRGKVKEETFFRVPVYLFKTNGTEYSCIGLKGHILNIDYPPKYNQWQKVDPKELIGAPIVKSPTQKNIISALQKTARGVEKVIIATDFDREGELIGFEAIDLIKKVNSGVELKRARYSALIQAEILNAFERLTDPFFSLAQAGEARQEIDLIWGATLTRFISLTSSRLGNQFLSVGRVQTPTLALLVERERQRQSFVPQPYWQLVAFFDAHGTLLRMLHAEETFWEKEKVLAIERKLSGNGEVKKVKKTEKQSSPPHPFDTTSFLSAASSIGIAPSYAMHLAESLYMNGYISYPRTDNTVYPKSLDLKGVLEKIAGGEKFGREAAELLAQKKIVSTRGKKETTDHPPIYPTGVAPRDVLDSSQWKVYELVVRRFLATVAQPSTLESVRIDVEMAGEPFFARGSRVTYEGWQRYYPYFRRKDEELPELREGDQLPFLESKVEDKETQPLSRFRQGKLIEKMDELGLGTKATRHSIIQNLFDRGYIHGDPIIASEMGMAVIESLKKHAEKITSHTMTAELENDMDKISDGKEELSRVVDKSRDMLRQIMDQLERHKEEVSSEISGGIRSDKIVGRCRVCGEDLRIIRSKKTKKRFVGCKGYPDCHETFPLPQYGEVIPTGDVCEYCEAPKVKVISKGKKPWVICIDPNCPSKSETRD